MDTFLEKIPSEMLQLLAGIAYVGANNGFPNESRAIFEAIVQARPDSLDARIAQGAGLIFSSNVTEGVRTLFSVLAKDPQNEMARSFLAIAFKMTHVDQHAISAAESVVKLGKNPSAKQLAQVILDSYQKPLSPMELQAKQMEQHLHVDVSTL